MPTLDDVAKRQAQNAILDETYNLRKAIHAAQLDGVAISPAMTTAILEIQLSYSYLTRNTAAEIIPLTAK